MRAPRTEPPSTAAGGTLAARDAKPLEDEERKPTFRRSPARILVTVLRVLEEGDDDEREAGANEVAAAIDDTRSEY